LAIRYIELITSLTKLKIPYFVVGETITKLKTTLIWGYIGISPLKTSCHQLQHS